MAVDAIYRLAIVEAHEWKCIICRKLITGEFDLDHLIPEEMETPGREVELAKLCADLAGCGKTTARLKMLSRFGDFCD